MNVSATDIVNNHYKEIIQKNVSGIIKQYYADDATYVILEGPRASTRGYDKIEKGWTDFCASSMALRSIEWIEGPFAHESGEMAWVAGIIRLVAEVKKGVVKENVFRVSFVLERQETNSDWQIIHEHVSFTNADPYGIGDWLQS